MPPLSGKDAILAAARRLAELGDDALDEDLLDAELALAGPAHDEHEAFAGGPVDGEPPLRPEDLGLPPRLHAWLARHGGRDVRRAFGVAARAAQRLVPDADGHVALGRAAGASVSACNRNHRPRYAPLEERVVPLSEAAAPTPRAFDFVPPAELAQREALRRKARSTDTAVHGHGELLEAETDPRRVDNAAVSAETKNLIANGSRREREADLPKGAGPAGRHEPTTRADERTSVPSRMGVSLFSSSREDDEKTRRGNLPPGLRRGCEKSKSSNEDEDARARLTGAERRAATNALLGRLPEGERPVIGTTSGQTYGGVVKKVHPNDDPLKVPRTVRQATLDALVAAALVAEAEARGVKAADAFEVMTSSWLAQRPKTRKRAIKAGVEAELRVFRAASSAAAYRGLAATALSALKKKATFTSDVNESVAINIPGRNETKEKETKQSAFRGDQNEKAGDENETDHILGVCGDLPDALCVVPRAALSAKRGSRLFLARADETAVAAAVAFAREGLETTLRRERGVGFVAAARAGALLQNYTNPDADRVDLRTATTPLGASVAFWAETARRRNPRRPRTPFSSRTGRSLGSAARAMTRRAETPSLDARDVLREREKREKTMTLSTPAMTRGTTEAKDEKDEGFRVSAGRETNADADAKNADTAKTVSISNAARALIRSFLEPFLDVGTITEAFARSIENKAAAKVLLKRGNEPDASFLERDKERDAVKALTREYVRRGEKRSARDAPPKETKETKRARAEAKPVGTRLETPKFDFDVDDL